MSGIVGIVNTDGAPVSRDLLTAMTEFLRFRGPDAQNLWCESEVGFGHALLDTGGARDTNKQPCSIDGRVWIVADARIDARAELAEKLRAAGALVPSGASDAQFILYAYQAWGKDCLCNLLGDFAFAIWDAPRKQLFCARDHFGVKPFYYANLPRSFVFSNTLNCLRFHPNVSSRLNDPAICDYLLFGGNLDPRTTSFELIERLPPAHFLICSDRNINISKYWTLPQGIELRYKKKQDYIENFRALLQEAVQDRLPNGRVAAFMSGGLDSSTVAAVAHRVLGNERQCRLQAYTAVYDRLIPDQERAFAGLAADFCGIPLHYLVADEYRLFQHWSDGDRGPAEPCDQPLLVVAHNLYRQMAVQSRVALTGGGGDPCLIPSATSVVKLLRTGEFWNLAIGYARCAFSQRTVPRVGLRTLIRKHTRNIEQAVLPEWINRELALKLDLVHRARDLGNGLESIQHHRPEAYKNVVHTSWANHFELYDPGNLPLPVETRNPFFDVRLVNFLLSLPTLPWCVGKQIIREAMKGFLPSQVLRRKKTALAGDPVLELLKKPQSRWIDSFQPAPELLHYMIPSRISSITESQAGSVEAWLNLRPITLDHWLRVQAAVRYKDQAQVREGFHGEV